MIYTLSGNPIPLARPRLGQHGIVYDCQTQAKESHRLELMFQHRSRTIYDKTIPLIFKVKFYMQIADSYSAKRKSQLLNKPHFKRPDLSNLIKYVEDVCNGIVFYDDAQIVEIVASKIYDEIPRTEFEIIPLA